MWAAEAGTTHEQPQPAARGYPRPGRAVSRVQQFLALLKKNALLQARTRGGVFGLGAWASLALQLLAPALFFLILCIPKYWIQPVPHRQQLQARAIDLVGLTTTIAAMRALWWQRVCTP